MQSEPRFELVASDEPKRMADTLLEYARPLIYQLPDDHTMEELKAVLVFAAVVWNAVVVEDIRHAVVHLSTKMPPRLRVAAPKAVAVVRRMLTRKDLCFGGDHRFALAVDVHRDGTEVRVTAIGIVPLHSRHHDLIADDLRALRSRSAVLH